MNEYNKKPDVNNLVAAGREVKKKCIRCCISLPDINPCCFSVPCFTNILEQNLYTAWNVRCSKSMDISKVRSFSILVINTGSNPVVFQPELSPDETTWGSFGERQYTVEAGEKQLYIPQYFLHFIRIKYRSLHSGLDSKINIWFQGQS